MAKRSTALYTAEYGSINGGKLYGQRARRILPALVAHAKAHESITYEELAADFDMPNARNLKYPLGTIGGAITTLSEKWEEDIPPIQALVVTKQSRLRGIGIADFPKPLARRMPLSAFPS